MNKYLPWGGVLFILIVGLFLRFFNIDFPYGWDQARDAFQVKGLLEGKLTLEGPRTGVGHFHLGPLWFYLLVPFFLLTNLDPIASQYLNIIINIFAFGIIFYITRKLFSAPLAFLLLSMYTVSSYIIGANRIPWNVSLIPTLSFLIFYFTYKTFHEKQYKYAALLMTFLGISFHAHFSSVIFPIMIGLLWLMSREKRVFLLLLKSIPFYLIWFIPTIIALFNNSDSSLFSNFLRDYFVGFHLQFFLHQLPQIFVQFRAFLFIPVLGAFLLLGSLLVRYLFAASAERLCIKIIFAWLLAYLAIFGVYGGQISDYYFLFTLPVVSYSFLIIVRWLFSLRSKIIPYAIFTTFIIYYLFQNSNNYTLPPTQGLSDQKQYVREQIKRKKVIKYKEGDISSYLYFIYKDK